MTRRAFASLPFEAQQTVIANIVGTALPLLVSGISSTLVQRMVHDETKHSRNLVEHVLSTHAGYRKLTLERQQIGRRSFHLEQT